MRGPLGLRWLTRALVLVALGVPAGCAREPAREEEGIETPPEVAASATVGDATRDTAETLRRFLPDEMRRATRAETFPHEAHVQIDCSVCHQVAQGHGSHDSVACAACHRASALATMRSSSPEQCASCHHGAQQALGCEDCHESRGVVRSEQRLALEVWRAPRSRTLSFDHGRHAGLDCASCHRAMPLLTPAEPCASCHGDHHTAVVRCASCHTTPPEGAHDVEAHLTCSGAGCHRAPEVEAIASTRAVCLVCHQTQEGHEPGGDCVECHRVRPGTVGRPDP